jgi:hypothetical protein
MIVTNSDRFADQVADYVMGRASLDRLEAWIGEKDGPRADAVSRIISDYRMGHMTERRLRINLGLMIRPDVRPWWW